jgi:hypothetical protein
LENRETNRDLKSMKLFGLMITKDDQAIFEDWCRSQLRFYDAVVCLDGSVTNDTKQIANNFADKIVYLHERDHDIPSKTDHGLRRVVHKEITRRFGVGNWVMCCHADEFCYHDPRKIIGRAAELGFDAVAWHSLQFYPHPDELPSWPLLQSLPIQERCRYYHWNYQGTGLPWCEDRLYLNAQHVWWDHKTHGSVRPHGVSRVASFRPILQHYKVITAELDWYKCQGGKTIYRHHWQGSEHKTGLPYSVDSVEDFFVSCVPGYLNCERFDGTISHSWNIEERFRPEDGEVSRRPSKPSGYASNGPGS